VTSTNHKEQTMDFHVFKTAVARQFAVMQKHQLFTVDVSGDVLWQTYLSSFPEGTNPIYRERTEHDCSCCKQFIRNIGGVVAIIGDKMVSIWDVELPAIRGYKDVAKALSSVVKSRYIANVYRHYERSVGTDKNFEQLVTGQKTWEHFYVTLPPAVVMGKSSIPTALGLQRTAYETLTRALETITMESIATVLELINQNSIYRGAEHKHLVTQFKGVADRLILTRMTQNQFVWSEVVKGNSALNAIRNSVIGTLLVDLSEGVPLERAVASFEAKVAPANYKRPTALVTQSMIAAAKKKIEDLGLLSALERRYANIDDIKVGDILFANANARRTITKDVFDVLSSNVKAKPKLDKVEDVSIDKFLSDVLPTITSMEVLVENRHASNFVSLVAPADPTAANMFKWNNAFSWSYNGDMADSMKERVKAAGGNVTGELCCRLAWEYSDDLDFHMQEPNGHRIHFGNRRTLSPNGGKLDVDANGCDGIREHPVENIFYQHLSKMQNGEYKIKVHNYTRRSTGVGFEVEVDLLGQIHHLVYEQVVPQGKTVEVATITKTKEGITVVPHIPSTQSSKSMWGIATQTFVPVTVMMMSPNHWEDTGSGIGNKHYFFMLENCINDGSARGFFNEFLKPELDQHRKVIEMVGSKMKTELSDRQLSGVGFSSTQRNSITCRITGSFTRTINITF